MGKIEENDADYEESTNNDDIDRLSVTSISVTVASLAALSDIADPLGDLQSLACPIGTPMKREAVDNTDSKSDVSSYCREPLRKKAAVEGDIKNMPQPKKVQRTVSEHDSGISSMQMSSDATDHQIVVSSLKIKEGKISKANTNAENTKNKNQIANENKKVSSEEGANEGYSYVSGQANLKPKVQQESNSTSSNDENETKMKYQ